MSTIWTVSEPAASSSLEAGVYSPLLQKILSVRGFKTESEIQKFIYPSLDHFHDPFLMKGMRGAVDRITLAVQRKEMILIHGDYDVDGITGAALLARLLRKLGAHFFVFLPNRKTDGYGVSREALKLAREKGASLFITVDCGITAFEEVKEANAFGIDTIIIDHHRIHDGAMPNAYAILNPLQEHCAYPFKELSAGGLAFKLAQALLGSDAFELLDLAALSSVCDVAPLVDENRAIVSFGLQTLSTRAQIGFRSLCEVSGLRRKHLVASDLGFILGPRINASGRMGSPETALKLLISTEERETAELARILDKENTARRDEDRLLLKKALQLVEREINFSRDRVIVVSGEGWHEGVIGIVAQRLVEYFHRPAVVIAINGERGKGSGRSIKGFHLFDGFKYCEESLEEFGGHELAAGLVISRENVKQFKEKLNEYAHALPAETFLKSIRIDFEISFDELSPRFFTELSLLEPFGAGNSRPVFLTRGVRTKRRPVQTKYGALQWWVTDGVNIFEAQWKSRGPEITFPDSEPYALVYSPAIKTMEGIQHVVLEIRDAKPEH